MKNIIMKLFGYENIENIKIIGTYKEPRTTKLKCKVAFYATTGKFQDNIIVNEKNILLDGYITYKICKWKNKKYVKVIRIKCTQVEYMQKYKENRFKNIRGISNNVQRRNSY